MYYPEALITTDLYTQGGEYMNTSGIAYIGFYWKAYDGRIYTGKNPQDPQGGGVLLKINQQQRQQLQEDIPTLNTQYSEIGSQYNAITQSPQRLVAVPYPVITPPTDGNYKVGSFTRYFCKRNNGEVYLEINQDQFNRLSKKANDILWQLYTPFSMFWKLTGDREQVFQTNKNLTQQVITTKKYYRFADFLKNQYLLYYKE